MNLSLRAWSRSLLLALLGASAPIVLHAQEPDSTTPILPDTNVEARQPEQPPPPLYDDSDLTGTVLEGTIFNSPPVDGYFAPSTTTATMINLPFTDVPNVVSTVTRDVLDDQIILEFEDIARNSGATVNAADTVFGNRIFVRGLELGSRDFRKDGFLDPTYVPRDFQNVERVEILKGPASFLYGPGAPSGLVNVITKKPLDAQFSDFGFTFGSFQQQRYTLDTNGWATSSGNVLYRVNVAHEDANSFRDFGFLSRTLVAPSVTWLTNDCTTLTWSGEWHRDNRRGDQGIPAINGDPLALPRSRYIGEPANDFLNTEEFRQSLVLNMQLSDTWALRLGGSSLFYNFPASLTSASFAFPNGDLVRSRSDILVADEQSQSATASLGGDFYTGDIKHTALVGGEYVYFDSNTSLAQGQVLDFPPFNAFNPVYTNPPSFTFANFEVPVFRERRIGGYLQDLVELTPNWKVLGGVRFDETIFTFDRTTNIPPFLPNVRAVTDQNFVRATPRGAVIYQPWEDTNLSCYFSYSQSFQPPASGIYLNSTPLQPILGESYEAGIKTELVDGLALTAAGFHITRNNADLNTGSVFVSQVGEERSQGAEVNLLGQVTDRLSTVANYSYTDVRLFDPTFAISGVPFPLDGQRQRNVPYNTANFWTRYNVVQDECQTAGVALGLVYLDRRPANLQNSVFLPAYSRWDAGLFYTRGQFNASVYIENLFDIYYDQSSINENQIFPGAPFNARASVSYIF